jgi:hypothetical protein
LVFHSNERDLPGAGHSCFGSSTFQSVSSQSLPEIDLFPLSKLGDCKVWGTEIAGDEHELSSPCPPNSALDRVGLVYESYPIEFK